MEVRTTSNTRGILWVIDSILIIIITLHWGFATGSLLAMKTPWSIPRFILICLMMRYFALSYGY